MKFRQKGQKLITHCPNCGNNLWLFSVKKIVSEILLKRRMLSTQPRLKILQKRPKILRSMSEIVWKTWICSQKKQLSSECHYGYEDCIFHNLTDSFSLKGQKSFAQGPYWYKRISSLQKKSIPQTWWFGHKSCSFHNLAYKLSTKGQNVRSRSENDNKTKFLPKKSFYP